MRTTNEYSSLIVWAAVLSAASGTAFADGTWCSLASMHGTYAGAGIHPKNGSSVATAFIESYDGQGRIKYYQELSNNGISHVTYSGGGTYTVGALTDTSSGAPVTETCVAFVHYDGDPATQIWHFFVAPDGSSFYFVNTFDLGSVAAGQETRISTALLVK